MDGAGLAGPDILLSALKPAEHGDGIVARLLNPTDTGATTTATADAQHVRSTVSAHALRSLHVTLARHISGS